MSWIPQQFKKRYIEGYDVQGDELYAVWELLKKLILSPSDSGISAQENQTSNPVHDSTQTKPVEKS